MLGLDKTNRSDFDGLSQLNSPLLYCHISPDKNLERVQSEKLTMLITDVNVTGKPPSQFWSFSCPCLMYTFVYCPHFVARSITFLASLVSMVNQPSSAVSTTVMTSPALTEASLTCCAMKS